MAQQITERLVDDLDGQSPAVETVPFGLDAANYEIDLSEKHAAKLRDALAPYMAAARRAGSSSSAPRRQTAAPRRGRDDLAEVRTWLAGNGYPVKNRGRINAAWLADYEAKSPNPPQQPKSKVTTVQAPVFQAGA